MSNLRLTVISLSGKRLIITQLGTLALLPKRRNRETLSLFSSGAVFLSFFAHIANFTKLQVNVTFMVLWMAKFWVWKEPGNALSDFSCFVRLVGYSPGFNDIPFLNLKNVSGHVME